MKETIGFIGLGNLGLPMATNLLESGYKVRAYNRTASKADALISGGAIEAKRPIDVLTPGGIVVTVLWDSAVVKNIVSSDSFLERLGKDGLHICMCTGSPEQAVELAALHASHGSNYLEAPVFGRPEAAKGRQLWIPIAGSAHAKERGRPILEAMGAQGVFDFGEEIGAALMTKLVGNFLIISMANAMTEAFEVSKHAGADSKAIFEMLTTTLFDAPIFRNYARALAENQTSFRQSPIPVKDLGLFIEVAKTHESSAPVAALMQKMMQELTTRGGTN